VDEFGEGIFEDCASLEEVVLPKNITALYGTFERCESLKTFFVPDSVKDIVWYAFASCESLQSITIPTSVKRIDYGAFADCASLTEIHYLGTMEQWLKINKGQGGWDAGSPNYTVYCTDGEIKKQNNQ
jgi:hypothetical protein